jgi:hypothetical protein
MTIFLLRLVITVAWILFAALIVPDFWVPFTLPVTFFLGWHLGGAAHRIRG